MPVLFRDTVTRQPQYPAAIDWGHPLAPKRGFVVSQHGGMTLLQWRGGRYALNIAQKIWQQRGSGFGAQSTTTGTTSVTLPPFGGSGTDGATVLFRASIYGSPSSASRIYDTDAGGGNTHLVTWISASSRWAIAIAGGGGANQWETTTSTASSITSADVVAFLNNGGTGASDTRAFINGAEQSVTRTTGTGGTAVGLSGNASFYFGNRGDGTRGWNGPIEILVYDQTARGAAEVVELSRNVWQIYQPPARKLWLMGAASGGTTVAPSKGALTFTGKQPSIAQTANQTVQPAKGALTFTGKQPTVAQSANQTVAPSKGAITFAGKQPTVTQTANQTVAPSKGALTFTGKQPTVSQDSGTVVAPSKGALTFQGGIPSIAQTANQIVVPSKGSLVFGGKAPTVEQSGAVTFTRAPGGGGYPATVPTTERYGMSNTKRPAMTNTRR